MNIKKRFNTLETIVDLNAEITDIHSTHLSEINAILLRMELQILELEKALEER